MKIFIFIQILFLTAIVIFGLMLAKEVRFHSQVISSQLKQVVDMGEELGLN